MQSGAHNCYQAQCTDNGIEVIAGGSTVICGPTDPTIATPSGTMNCPDKDIFCSVKDCPDWCGTKGICINGECISE